MIEMRDFEEVAGLIVEPAQDEPPALFPRHPCCFYECRHARRVNVRNLRQVDRQFGRFASESFLQTDTHFTGIFNRDPAPEGNISGRFAGVGRPTFAPMEQEIGFAMRGCLRHFRHPLIRQVQTSFEHIPRTQSSESMKCLAVQMRG